MSRFLILPPKQLETKIRQKNNNMKQRKPNRHGHIPIPSRYLQINNPLIHFHAKKAEFETLAPGFLSIAKGQNFSESEFTPWLNHLKSVVKSYLIPRMVGKWWLLLFVFLFQKPKHGRDRRDAQLLPHFIWVPLQHIGQAHPSTPWSLTKTSILWRNCHRFKV